MAPYNLKFERRGLRGRSSIAYSKGREYVLVDCCVLTACTTRLRTQTLLPALWQKRSCRRLIGPSTSERWLSWCRSGRGKQDRLCKRRKSEILMDRGAAKVKPASVSGGVALPLQLQPSRHPSDGPSAAHISRVQTQARGRHVGETEFSKCLAVSSADA